MGLFSRRKAAPVAEVSTWEPVWDEPAEQAGDEADMGDDAQATNLGYRAYMVAFRNDAAPDALITVWTYACYVGDEGYGVRLRYEYGAGSDENWTASGYEHDPLEEVYWTAENAYAEAYAWGAVLAAGNPDSMGNLPEVFEWDGEPFPVGDPG